MGLHKHLCTPENVVIAMYDYYKAGHSLKETSRKFGVSMSGISKAFRRHGFLIRSRTHGTLLAVSNPSETLAMYADYKAGMSITAVAKKYGYGHSAVGGRFQRMRLPTRKPWDWRTMR